MLLALALASRSSDLIRFTLLAMKFIPEGVELRPSGLAKHTQPGRELGLQPIVVPRFDQDSDLCPVQCLKSYLKVTADFR